MELSWRANTAYRRACRAPGLPGCCKMGSALPWMGTKGWFTWKMRPEMQLAYIGFFYLLGSIPVAWLMGRLAGQGDIRRLGSGNAGVMNVALNVSRWAALIVMASETAKGVATVLLAQKWQLS